MTPHHDAPAAAQRSDEVGGHALLGDVGVINDRPHLFTTGSRRLDIGDLGGHHRLDLGECGVHVAHPTTKGGFDLPDGSGHIGGNVFDTVDGVGHSNRLGPQVKFPYKRGR